MSLMLLSDLYEGIFELTMLHTSSVFHAVCVECSINITVAGAVMYNNGFMECRPHLKEPAVLNGEA